MLKVCFLIISSTLVCLLQAQTLERQVVSSGGSASPEFTIGESFVESSNIQVSVGFHQTELLEISEALGVNDISHHLNVYPNPSTDWVNISGTGIGEKSEIEIFTSSGQRVHPAVEKSNEFISVQFHELPSGNYFLRLVDAESKSIAHYKLLKIN